MNPYDHKRILDRISELKHGPQSMSFELVYDKETSMWLARQEWLRMTDPEHRLAAEGATPAEVLRKLAEMLET